MSSILRTDSIRVFPEQNSIVASITTAVSISNTGKKEIDVGDVAKKTFASLVTAMTNSILTITVGVTKLTGFAILPSVALGWITKPLHAVNVALAKHAFNPFKKWAAGLGKENKRIIETDKMIEIRNKKLMFYPEAYKIQALDSVKIIAAPITLTLSVTIAAVWIAVKPLWAAIFLPGLLADTIILAPMALNKAIGALTYSPLAKVSDRMLEFQGKWVSVCWTDFSRTR